MSVSWVLSSKSDINRWSRPLIHSISVLVEDVVDETDCSSDDRFDGSSVLMNSLLIAVSSLSIERLLLEIVSETGFDSALLFGRTRAKTALDVDC